MPNLRQRTYKQLAPYSVERREAQRRGLPVEIDAIVFAEEAILEIERELESDSDREISVLGSDSDEDDNRRVKDVAVRTPLAERTNHEVTVIPSDEEESCHKYEILKKTLPKLASEDYPKYLREVRTFLSASKSDSDKISLIKRLYGYIKHITPITTENPVYIRNCYKTIVFLANVAPVKFRPLEDYYRIFKANHPKKLKDLQPLRMLFYEFNGKLATALGKRRKDWKFNSLVAEQLERMVFAVGSYVRVTVRKKDWNELCQSLSGLTACLSHTTQITHDDTKALLNQLNADLSQLALGIFKQDAYTKTKVQRPPNERDQFKLQRLSAECWAAIWVLMDRCGIESLNQLFESSNSWWIVPDSKLRRQLGLLFCNGMLKAGYQLKRTLDEIERRFSKVLFYSFLDSELADDAIDYATRLKQEYHEISRKSLDVGSSAACIFITSHNKKLTKNTRIEWMRTLALNSIKRIQMSVDETEQLKLCEDLKMLWRSIDEMLRNSATPQNERKQLEDHMISLQRHFNSQMFVNV